MEIKSQQQVWVLVPVLTTSGKNSKYTGPMTRSRTKNALIQLLETIPENLLTDAETECEDNVLTDNNNETDGEGDFIHISHSDVEEH